MSNYTDILYEVKGGVARISINRPEKYNAFRGKTCDELIDALHRAGWDKSIGVIVLTGVGEKAFCTGGDQSAHDGGYDGRGLIGLPVEELQGMIREVPKPVIARVNGFAIGGGNVLVTCCDLAIAADTAQFGQVGKQPDEPDLTGHRVASRGDEFVAGGEVAGQRLRGRVDVVAHEGGRQVTQQAGDARGGIRIGCGLGDAGGVTSGGLLVTGEFLG